MRKSQKTKYYISITIVFILVLILGISFIKSYKRKVEIPKTAIEQDKNITQKKVKIIIAEELPDLSNQLQTNKISSKLSSSQAKENEDFFLILKQLEKSAKQFCSENQLQLSPKLLILQYLRSGEKAYRTKSWNAFAGEANEVFSKWVMDQKMAEDFEKLRSLDAIWDSATGDKIDWTHLTATLNVNLYQGAAGLLVPELKDAGGWLGDCIQLAADMKAKGIRGVQIKISMQSEIGKTGRFSGEDLRADLDAWNIAGLLSQSDTLAETCEKYYETLTNESRCSLFIEKRFPKADSLEKLKDDILHILSSNNLVIQKLCNSENLTAEGSEEYLKNAGECFAEWIWSASTPSHVE